MFNLRNHGTRRAEALSQLRMAELAERRMTAHFRSELDRAMRVASEAYPNWERTIPQHKQNMYRMMRQQSELAASLAANRARSNFKKGMPWRLEWKLNTEEQLNTRVTLWAQSNAAKKVTSVSDTTRKRISDIIAAGVGDDKHPDEIARTIRDTMDMSHRRALTIARTESHAAQMTGQHMSMEETSKELDMPMLKVWVCTQDQNTRDTHVKADGQKVKMDDKFKVGEAELAYPGDPSGPPEEVINCRCAIVYETDDSAARKPEPEKPVETPQPEAEPEKPVEQVASFEHRIKDGQWTGSQAEFTKQIRLLTGSKLEIEYSKASKGAAYAVQRASAQASMLRSMSDMKAKGMPMGQLHTVKMVTNTNANDLWVAQMWQHGQMDINLNSHIWGANGVAEAAKLGAKNWWVIGSREGIIAHEMGHHIHKLAAGQAYYKLELTAAEKLLVRKQVSEYGMKNNLEFVAETYSGLANGRKFSAEVMNLYKKYSGPVIPNKTPTKR